MTVNKNHKIFNSVYGLALGDSLGYPTEFLDWEKTIATYNRMKQGLPKELLVTDDTQMSIAMIEGIRQAFINDDPELTEEQREFELVNEVGHEYVNWAISHENTRAPGRATMEALGMIVNRCYHFQTVAEWTHFSNRKKPSKGSGTVMRAVWLGCLAPVFENNERLMHQFSDNQSKITHRHDTAVLGAWLTTKIAMELFEGRIQLGGLREFALEYMDETEHYFSYDDGSKVKNHRSWNELRNAIVNSFQTPENYEMSSITEFDPAWVCGTSFAAETVLSTALMLADMFGADRPFEVLERAMVSMGDTDTIGAIAGGLVGLGHNDPLWSDKMGLIEKAYVGRLDRTIEFMQSIVE